MFIALQCTQNVCFLHTSIYIFAINYRHCFVCVFKELSILSFNVLIQKKLESNYFLVGINPLDGCISSCWILCAMADVRTA